MPNGLEQYLSELRKEQPIKCQRCECLEITWNGADWVAECSELQCYDLKKVKAEK